MSFIDKPKLSVCFYLEEYRFEEDIADPLIDKKFLKKAFYNKNLKSYIFDFEFTQNNEYLLHSYIKKRLEYFNEEINSEEVDTWLPLLIYILDSKNRPLLYLFTDSGSSGKIKETLISFVKYLKLKSSLEDNDYLINFLDKSYIQIYQTRFENDRENTVNYKFKKQDILDQIPIVEEQIEQLKYFYKKISQEDF